MADVAAAGPVFLKTAEVAARFGITTHMVQAEYRSGRLPFRRVGRFIRFTAEDLDAYVATTAAVDAPGTLRRSDAARRRRRRTA